MATDKSNQLAPEIDYRDLDGTFGPIQKPTTEYIRYRYTGIKADKAYVAIQVRGGLEWSHEYAPGTVVNPAVSEMTQMFRVNDQPNIWFYYEQP